MNIKCFDNNGESADRYTVVFLDYPERYPNLYVGLSMDQRPSHPQGICMTCTVQLGSHLGKRIDFDELPETCRVVVKRFLESEE